MLIVPSAVPANRRSDGKGRAARVNPVADDKLAGTTVSSSDETIVSVTQAKEEGGATFNPGGECLAAGSATITVTSPDNTTRDIAITVQ